MRAVFALRQGEHGGFTGDVRICQRKNIKKFHFPIDKENEK